MDYWGTWPITFGVSFYNSIITVMYIHKTTLYEELYEINIVSKVTLHEYVIFQNFIHNFHCVNNSSKYTSYSSLSFMSREILI
jgi:hypothetical protein